MRILTIGGYGFTERGFLGALQSAGVDTFIDVRQRRGMRGPKYAFLNSSRLQNLLAEAGIKYVHALALAPTASVRTTQKDTDKFEGVAKRDRSSLSPEFARRYRAEVLEPFDPRKLRAELKDAKTVALFCVEGPASACHRSLAAEYLAPILGADADITNLMP